MADAVRRQYDRAARRYDRRWAGYVGHTLDLLESRARVRPGERVLDVACGTGVFLVRLADAGTGAELTGVDVSGGMLEEARRKLSTYPRVHLVQALAEALPFPDRAFDVVVSASALHYVDRPDAALAEGARVLRPGGRLVILDWERSFWWIALLDAGLRLVDRAHQRTHTAAEVGRWASAAGLDVRTADRVRRGFWGLYMLTAHKPEP